MLDLARFHPQLVHFAITLGFLGVALRLWSLVGPGAWVRPAATAILLAGTLAVVVAAKSGIQAHGPVEDIPGVGEAVHEHEEAGERAHWFFAAVFGLELLALALRKRERLSRGALIASGLVGVAGCVVLFQAARLGGRLVYSYAGGVGTTGEPGDTARLLVAGLHGHASSERAAGHLAEAARLTDELARQLPNDTDVKLLVIESLIGDRKNPQGALAALAALPAAEGDVRLQIQKGLLTSKAQLAQGNREGARTTLQDLAAKFPKSRWAGRALAELK